MLTENFAFGPNEALTLCLCTAGCAAPIDDADGPVFIPLIDLEPASRDGSHFISSHCFFCARAPLVNCQMELQPPLSRPFGITMAQ